MSLLLMSLLGVSASTSGLVMARRFAGGSNDVISIADFLISVCPGLF
jgi:hypothetical protein